LSAVFDEVVVKERLLVEGGASKQILSQFDGPVTFNSDLRLSDNTKQLITEASLRAQDAKFRDTTNSTAVSNGSVVIDGGVGIAKSVYIGGDIIGTGGFDGQSNISGITSVTAGTFFGDGAGLQNTGSTLSAASGTQRIVLTSLTTGQMTTTATDSDLSYNADTNTLNCPNLNGSLTGNAALATLSTNVVGAANRVLFNNAVDTTTTSADFTYNGTQLNVGGNVRANGITLGLTNGTTIDTVSGDLTLDSSNNKVVADAKFEVLNSTNATSKDTGALVITQGGLGVEGNIHSGGDIVAFSSSDMTLKENISPISNALEMINSLTGNTFAWKPEAGIMGNSGMDTGIIAQEVEALGLPGVAKRRGDGTMGVRYDRLIPVLIEAVKELSAKVKSLESNK